MKKLLLQTALLIWAGSAWVAAVTHHCKLVLDKTASPWLPYILE